MCHCVSLTALNSLFISNRPRTHRELSAYASQVLGFHCKMLFVYFKMYQSHVSAQNGFKLLDQSNTLVLAL